MTLALHEHDEYAMPFPEQPTDANDFD